MLGASRGNILSAFLFAISSCSRMLRPRSLLNPSTLASMPAVGVNGKSLLRLVGFQSETLAPGEKRAVTLDVDPRLLGNWVGAGFEVAGGAYDFALGRSATDLGSAISTHIPAFRPSMH